MLQQRILTAVVLLAILLPALFYPDIAVFMGLAVVLVSAGAWEWANLNQCKPVAALAIALVFALGCCVSWYVGLVFEPFKNLWIMVGGGWILGGAWLLHGGIDAWRRVPMPLRLAIGLLGLWVAWIAAVQARRLGINFLISTLALVWIADVFAYFSGRALGGRFFQMKLAPSISPGKTWEGALGGLLGVLVVASIWRIADSQLDVSDVSIFSILGRFGFLFMCLAVIFLTTMSVMGDLIESLFKRSAGFKDSSGLLPGHGGVLDRLDAILPVLPLAMMFVSI
jgi:phosphatidate cytidylyltransferase